MHTSSRLAEFVSSKWLYSAAPVGGAAGGTMRACGGRNADNLLMILLYISQY